MRSGVWRKLSRSPPSGNRSCKRTAFVRNAAQPFQTIFLPSLWHPITVCSGDGDGSGLEPSVHLVHGGRSESDRGLCRPAAANPVVRSPLPAGSRALRLMNCGCARIEPVLPDELANNYAAETSQSDTWDLASIWNKGLHGEGEIVGCADTGLDYDHCHFWDRNQPAPTSTINLNHRKIVGCAPHFVRLSVFFFLLIMAGGVMDAMAADTTRMQTAWMKWPDTAPTWPVASWPRPRPRWLPSKPTPSNSMA